MGFGWEGELVRLAPLDIDKHLENAFRWMNDPEVTQYLAMGDFPLTRLAEKAWFEERSKQSQYDLVFAIETLSGTHIGFSGIHNISWQSRCAVTGTILCTAEWGKGYGTDAARVRSRYCFDVLNLRLLMSEYLDGNDRSRRMQEKAGYIEFGRIPSRYWKRGAYRDGIQTYLTRDNWEKLK